ncbi:MAG: UTP--glucose-1-phosphate uridylyltransferase [Aerococcus sp.]|nr:UTP--glucose-1-phosphate uridylyltransferase [Aerococcus sp.]
MKQIRKAVIPAAGMGTRFLPATKALAKEIMPIVDKPVIEFIVEEVLASGIEEILIITGRNKRAIEDHFDANIELENNLAQKGKDAMLETVRRSTLGNVQFKRQHYPNGLGNAVLEAESFVGDEPFLLALGDDIFFSGEGEPTASKQVIDAFAANDAMTVLAQQVSSEEATHYGIMTGECVAGTTNSYRLSALEEKPAHVSGDARALCGRYALTPEIFPILRDLADKQTAQELALTEALDVLAKREDVYGLDYAGEWFEVGEPLGMLKASIQVSLHHPEIADSFRDYLKNDVIPRLKK